MVDVGAGSPREVHASLEAMLPALVSAVSGLKVCACLGGGGGLGMGERLGESHPYRRPYPPLAPPPTPAPPHLTPPCCHLQQPADVVPPALLESRDALVVVSDGEGSDHEADVPAKRGPGGRKTARVGPGDGGGAGTSGPAPAQRGKKVR